MLFNSLEYLLFLPGVLGLYLVMPRAARWLVLLAASYAFYMSWRWQYGLLILFCTAVNYGVGLRLKGVASPRARIAWLWLAVTASLGVLFTYKYFNFFADSVNALAGTKMIRTMGMLLPVGISFYTFQTLSYTIDVYRNRFEPVTHFGKFALYVAFFPQLVAGPIERPQHLVPQLLRLANPTPSLVASGLRLILWGVFKKVVIADRLAFYVNAVFESPNAYAGPTIALAAFFFGIQIYCDFSGYSDIAVGSSRLFGIRLMQNFHFPYTATSVRQFWHRWHISLSTWFRDYVYIPLGGNRVATLRLKWNLLVTFVVSGLWHGANWTFVFWGALHGFLLLGEIWLEPRGVFRRVPPSLRCCATFLLVHLAWIVFRANCIADLGILFRNLGRAEAWMHPTVFLPGVARMDVAYGLVLAPGLLVAEWLWRQATFQRWFGGSTIFRFALYLAMGMALAVAGVFSESNAFIYFQF